MGEFSRLSVFANIVVTTTQELNTLSDGGAGVQAARMILLEVSGGTAPDWTLDIQGKTFPTGVYTNLDYEQVEIAGVAGLTNAQIAITDTTTRFYLIPNPPEFVQLIAIRVAGSLTVFANTSTEPVSQWLRQDTFGNLLVKFTPAPTGGWTASHEPATNVQATATKAAAGAGVKNIIRGLTVVLAAFDGLKPSPTQRFVRLIDGPSGGPTILWRAVSSIPGAAGATDTIALAGMAIEGSPNTAMTLEFSAAGGPNTIESVSMWGEAN